MTRRIAQRKGKFRGIDQVIRVNRETDPASFIYVNYTGKSPTYNTDIDSEIHILVSACGYIAGRLEECCLSVNANPARAHKWKSGRQLPFLEMRPCQFYVINLCE